MKQTISILLMCAATLTAGAQAPSVYNASVWPARHMTWTQTTLLTVRTLLPRLEKARDLESFCPDYAKASARSREICWLRIVGAIAKFESSFHPNDMFHEKIADVRSIGLLSLSPGESEIAPTAEMLKVPELNLQAGITILAAYVERDGYLSGPEGQRGGAGYWAVLREPYKVGEFTLGHRDQVIQYSSRYLNF